MDSSVNINSEIISFKKYLLSNTDILKDILNNLEKISCKSREAFKAVLTKDNRIDNQLLELNQSKTHGFAWFDTYRIGTKKLFKVNDEYWHQVYDDLKFWSNCFSLKKNDNLIHKLINKNFDYTY